MTIKRKGNNQRNSGPSGGRRNTVGPIGGSDIGDTLDSVACAFSRRDAVMRAIGLSCYSREFGPVSIEAPNENGDILP